MLGVVVSFFSPCGYLLPKRHLASTLEWLSSLRIPVAVTQATLPKQEPQPVPARMRHRVYPDADPMFLKENLWNLGADLLQDCDSLAFIDCDIRLNDGWERYLADVLLKVDVCQPFYRCRWLDRDGKISRQKTAAAKVVQQGNAPWPHRNHPGFALAMTRTAYDKLGGLYEKSIAGGGDLAFWLAMSSHKETDTIISSRAKADELNVEAPSFVAYRKNALANRLRIGFVPGVTATHLWHGEQDDRHYVTRERFFPRQADSEPSVRRRPDGLLGYTEPAPLAASYFALRKEDG